MIVVSDTSPLTALLTIGEAELLPKLFTEVVIPEAEELLRSHSSLPQWIRAQTVRDSGEVQRLRGIVDLREAEAIALAKELRAQRLLIDERKGRRLAAQEGVPIIGLVGVLLLGKQLKLISSVRNLLDRLRDESGIYLSEEIRTEVLKSAGE